MDDLLTDLTGAQFMDIRNRVLSAIDSIAHGDYTDYEGAKELAELAAGVKARGRRELARDSG